MCNHLALPQVLEVGLQDVQRFFQWLKIVALSEHHIVLVEVHMLLSRPTPAQKLGGGDDGGGEADVSRPNDQARDLGGLAGHAAADVGVQQATLGLPVRWPGPLARSTGHQVKATSASMSANASRSHEQARLNQVKRASLAIVALWWTLRMAMPGASVAP